MDTMLTLGTAARQLGVSKGTISKAIATGKLSATRREDGSWAIPHGTAPSERGPPQRARVGAKCHHPTEIGARCSLVGASCLPLQARDRSGVDAIRLGDKPCRRQPNPW